MDLLIPGSGDVPELRRLLSLLPADRPFAAREASDLGVGVHARRALVAAGLLVHPVRGAYHVAVLTDTLELRVSVLRLVVPRDCVVTDRTAAYLWGAPMALAPGDHLEVPRVSVFAPPGRRLRNGLTASGERSLAPGDVVDLDGLLVTSPLRTACDVARLLQQDQALGVMDQLAAIGSFGRGRLNLEMRRFKGYRGVVQARVLADLVDARSQSMMESISRRRWHDAGLPRPECQVPVPGPCGWYYVDIGLPRERFGMEYDGEEHHGPEQERHDRQRRDWITGVERWRIVVVRRANVTGPHQDAETLLRAAWREHQARKAR